MRILEFQCRWISNFCKRLPLLNTTKYQKYYTETNQSHYSDAIMDAMASQITGVSVVYSTVCSGAEQKKSKFRVTGLWGEFTGEFPAQKASKAQNVSIWWRHHETAIDGTVQKYLAMSLPGPRFNIKMSSYQYRKSNCGDKTVVRWDFLYW